MEFSINPPRFAYLRAILATYSEITGNYVYLHRTTPQTAFLIFYSLTPDVAKRRGFIRSRGGSNSSNISNKTNKNYFLLQLLLELQNNYYLCSNEYNIRQWKPH